jgi:hypothetical protein
MVLADPAGVIAQKALRHAAALSCLSSPPHHDLQRIMLPAVLAVEVGEAVNAEQHRIAVQDKGVPPVAQRLRVCRVV